MIDLITNLLSNGVVRVVLFGTLTLGLVSGTLGVFTILRKQALIGDALSHSTLPGVVLMFVFTTSKNVSVLIIGAAVSAGVAMLLMRWIKSHSILENDAILALTLSSFFGFGRFLISLVSRYPDYSKVKLDDFIFGSAATIIERDVYTLVVVCLLVLALILLSWRHLKLATFNSDFYESLGFSSTIIEFLMAFMTILVIVVGIRTVGVILMSALLIVPGLAARQWSDRLVIFVLLAAIFGSLSALIGTIYSVTFPGGLPTGPVIVIVGTMFALVSILISPKHGLIAKELQHLTHRKNLEKNHLLINFSIGNQLSQSSYQKLIADNLIALAEGGEHKLTQKGKAQIKKILKEEYYG